MGGLVQHRGGPRAGVPSQPGRARLLPRQTKHPLPVSCRGPPRGLWHRPPPTPQVMGTRDGHALSRPEQLFRDPSPIPRVTLDWASQLRGAASSAAHPLSLPRPRPVPHVCEKSFHNDSLLARLQPQGRLSGAGVAGEGLGEQASSGKGPFELESFQVGLARHPVCLGRDIPQRGFSSITSCAHLTLHTPGHSQPTTPPATPGATICGGRGGPDPGRCGAWPLGFSEPLEDLARLRGPGVGSEPPQVMLQVGRRPRGSGTQRPGPFPLHHFPSVARLLCLSHSPRPPLPLLAEGWQRRRCQARSPLLGWEGK